ncbi:unnamed protein product, partial [Brassica rapa subsp. trilocularis]
MVVEESLNSKTSRGFCCFSPSNSSSSSPWTKNKPPNDSRHTTRFQRTLDHCSGVA